MRRILKRLEWNATTRCRKLHWAFGAFEAAIMALMVANSAKGADAMATRVISAGAYNSMAITTDGSVWGWGQNSHSELGDVKSKKTTILPTPFLFHSVLTDAVSIAAGGLNPGNAHTLVLRSDGTVLAAGDNNYGELGDGTLVAKTNIVVVTNLTGVVAIAAGQNHSLALKSDGTVWGWGANGDLQTGKGTTVATSLTQPTIVTNLTGVVAIAAGNNHSLALKSDGTVWSWGLDTLGQLGNGTNRPNQKAPVSVANLINIIAISAGGDHSLALSSDGKVWAWGNNVDGELGILTNTAAHYSPVLVSNLFNVVGIAAGGKHCLALKADGTVWGWGKQDHGQTGSGNVSITSQTQPIMVPDISGVMSIAAGETHSLAQLADGSLLAWGDSSFGQLGSGANIGTAGKNNPRPIKVNGLGDIGLSVKEHSLAVKMDGTTWGFGYNKFGQIGDGGNFNRNQPTEVRYQFETRCAAAGGGHSLAIKLDNSVWAWGNNSHGQLGDGTTINRFFTGIVPGLAGVTNVAAGEQHSLALTTNGNVFGWGANNYGQIGNGNLINQTSPVLVTNLGIVAGIAAGGNHSLALLTNRTIMAWGQNSYGQLGDGSLSNRIGGVVVTNLNYGIAVAAGRWHSLVLLTNGTVWSWGNNMWGQLGDGTTSNRLTPVQVTNLTGITNIAAGAYFSAALATNGTVWVWGDNRYGQIGNSTTNNQTTPVQISGLSGVKAIQAGDNHLVVTMADLTLQVWGRNDCGQLGEGNHGNQRAFEPIDFHLNQDNYQPVSLSLSATNWARYTRGNSTNYSCLSVVSPLNFQKGIALDPTGNNTNYFNGLWPWFSFIQKDMRHHVDISDFGNNLYAYPLAFDNPIVAFGESEGGTPLYINQSYHFGVYVGARIINPTNTSYHVEYTNTIRILVYDKSNFNGSTNIAPIATNDIYLPRQYVDFNDWNNFAKNGFSTSINAYGLRTDLFLEESPISNIGYPDNSVPFGHFGHITYILTHTASDAAKNYYYRIEALGAALMATNWLPYVTNSSGNYSRSILYTLDFTEHPSWRADMVDQPHFQGTPAPPFYPGKTPADLTNTPVVINYSINLSDVYTNIDGSPELRRHEILDRFVSDMGNNPIALASYVVNEIDLSDYMAYGRPGVPYASINLGGINRGALGTFLEKQGSPAEQCALLVYLLRQAGCKAAYMYPTNNNLSLRDTRLGNLLHMKIKGAEVLGNFYTTNENIVVNYPWVVANIVTNGITNTVHIFPWLKDTEIIEGLNLYDYLPTNYNSGFKWVKAYIHNDPNIISSIFVSNSPALLFSSFIQKNLDANYPGISVDDIGVKIVNRKHEFNNWSDFPVPDVISDVPHAPVVQDFNTITNQVPWLTNYFDTVKVEVVHAGTTNGAVLLTTGDMLMSDVHNRRLVVATNGLKTVVWMAPYRTNTSGLGNFGSFLTNNYLSAQSNSFTTTATNTSMTINFIYKKHRFAYDPNSDPIVGSFLGVAEKFVYTNSRPFSPNEVAGLCMNVGRVTKEMLQTHIEEYWAIQQKKENSSAYKPPVVDYAGTAAYLMGMTFFQKCAKWDKFISELHKITEANISQFESGLGIIATRAGGKAQPIVDMVFQCTLAAANNTLHPDSDIDPILALTDYDWVSIAGASAEEHQTVNQVFHGTNAISTVFLLQLAHQLAKTNVADIVEVTTYNFQNVMTNKSLGYGSKLLKDYDFNTAQSIGNAFATTVDFDSSFAFYTPAPMTNDDRSYKGMGALIYTVDACYALISGNLNGAWGDNIFGFDPEASAILWEIQLSIEANELALSFINSYTPQFNDTGVTIITPALPDPIAATPNQTQVNAGDTSNQILQNNGTANQTLSLGNNVGNMGPPSDYSAANNTIADPVNPITGEFYIDAVDLSLPGPMPLQIRRNYSSQNPVDNQFGYGWKFNYMPFLVLTTNNTTHLVKIYAAEMDGSVVAYQQTATNIPLYTPKVGDNPLLDNYSKSGIGSVANLFNAQITNYTVGTNIYYRLDGADGSTRQFMVQAFTITNQTHSLKRERPYLLQWTDKNGNSLKFSYYSNSADSDYGQVKKIQCSNGNYVGFYYDIFRHITEAYTGDGRIVHYDYDENGDLVKVTSPDSSEIQYAYQSVLTNNHTFSTHLLNQEIKPDGRILQNIYDNTNRVTDQFSTVGLDLNLYRNAHFFYSNNFTANITNLIHGYTLITDINNNVIRYEYTNSCTTNIVDQLGQSIRQEWFWTNDSFGGFQRSLKSTTDKRGLVTSYFYDSKGNVVTNIIFGTNLTGFGDSYATNLFTYNTDNRLLTKTGPTGIHTKFAYGDSLYSDLPTSVELYASNGVCVNTNLFTYTYASNVLVNGTLTTTNLAFGLLARSIRASGTSDASTNEFFYDDHGFLIGSVNYSGSTDPSITNNYTYDERGQMIQQSVQGGGSAKYGYDPVGHVTDMSIFDAGSLTPVASEYFYYNDNGEIVWWDGPRYNPEDYVWMDYDGAGRKTEEIHWRSRAKSDGSGVEAETGDNLFATTYYEYDAFGDLITITDQHGNRTRFNYDGLGQLTARLKFAPNNPAPLIMEQFAHEPGGQISALTNSLGGKTSRAYTTDGKLMQQTNADGSILQWFYYLDGRPRRQVFPNSSYLDTTYDDANRQITWTLYTSGGVPLATNLTEFDRRGNIVRQVDAGLNSVTNIYDGLDRIKQRLGPGATSSSGQQVVRYAYDPAGRQLTISNALGEFSRTTYDAMGRVLTNAVYDAANNQVRLSSSLYSADFNSTSFSIGSGTNSIKTTLFTDTFDKPVLAQEYPATNLTNYAINTYDILENLVASQDELGRTTTYAYDALSRPIKKVLPDGASIQFGFNAMGSLTNRLMPGGLNWSAVYNPANRIVSEQLTGGLLANRQFAYQYDTTTGLLNAKFDLGRSVSNIFLYDPMFRLVTNITSGPLPDQNLTLFYQYDQLGMLTNFDQVGSSSSTVQRSYDNYGQIIEEKVLVNDVLQSDFLQSWDSAGRCIALTNTGAGFGGDIQYSWRADGLLSNTLQAGQNYKFGYANNGLLTSRSNSWRSLTINQRDGRGRALLETTRISGTNVFTEALSWKPDSTLAGYDASRLGGGAWDENLNFKYSIRSQLTNQSVGLSTGSTTTNNYDFTANGVLISAQESGALTNTWFATGINDLAQVTNEAWQQSGLIIRAGGAAVNANAVSATFGGGDTSTISGVTLQGGHWLADLGLTLGSHTLTATANYSIGQYAASAKSVFTVTGTNNVTNYYDGAGNITGRMFANGKTQVLTWDGGGRLVNVVQRDNSTNGFNWSAIYDGFGRRLQTVYIPVTMGYTNTAAMLTIGSAYDPRVEFLELAVTLNGKRTWKVEGPDQNGKYGGMQGSGGLEATVRENDGYTTPVLNNYFGDVQASVNASMLTLNWNSTRLSGYGPLLGYQSPTLSAGISLADASIWRTRRADPSGFYYLGARYYEPIGGRFLSADPLGHGASMDLYSYCDGDPLNNSDPDGRLAARSNTIGDANAPPVISGGIAPEMTQSLLRSDVGSDGQETAPYPVNEPTLRSGDYLGSYYYRKMIPTGRTLAYYGSPSDISGFVNPATYDQTPHAITQHEVEQAQQMRVIIYGPIVALNLIAIVETGGAAAADVTVMAEAAESGFGGGTIFSHFTDATGLEGITGVRANTLVSGQRFTVGQLNFGMGANPFLASAPGDIFVTDLPATAAAGELNGVGVFGAKQSFAIQFSQETSLLNAVRPIMQRPGIFTIPGGTTMQGTFQIIAR